MTSRELPVCDGSMQTRQTLFSGTFNFATCQQYSVDIFCISRLLTTKGLSLYQGLSRVKLMGKIRYYGFFSQSSTLTYGPAAAQYLVGHSRFLAICSDSFLLSPPSTDTASER